MAEQRDRFYAKSVFGLSVAILVIGAVCVPCGILAVYYSLATACYYKPYHDNYNNDYQRHSDYDDYELSTTTTTTVPTTAAAERTDCRYYGSIFGAGIWVGIMYITIGIIGMIAGRTKSSCMILCLMVLSLPCFFISIAGVGFGIFSQFDGSWGLLNGHPVPMIIANAMLSFLAFAVMVMDIIIFAFTCRALCCSKQTVHYTELLNKETEANALQWLGNMATNIQFPPQSSGNLEQTSAAAPQMMLVVPDGKGGFVPFQAANIMPTPANQAATNQPIVHT